MIIFIFRRIGLLFITLLLLTLISFSLNYFPRHAALNGLPILHSYYNYFIGLLHGDFGVSSINGESIGVQLFRVIPATLELGVIAYLLALIMGIPLGILAGVFKGKWQDATISAFALLGFSIPVFGLALFLMFYFSVYMDWFPISGRIDVIYSFKPITGFTLIDSWLADSPYRGHMILSALHHLALPVVAATIAPLTEVIRLMRINTEDVINQNYIKAAMTRGLSRFSVIRRHVLHNALLPLIPQLGLLLSTMLTVTMIVEVVFDWPGVGCWLIHAVQVQDYAAISAGVMTMCSLVISVNILTDILGAVMNPLKYKETYAFR